MKRIITLILIFSTLSLYSQNLTKGFEYLNKHEYKKAYKIFDKALEKKKDVIAARYGLAMILSDTNYSGFNNLMAYNHITEAAKRYKRYSMAYKKSLEAKYGITWRSIMQLRDKIVNYEYEKLMQKPDLQSINDFLDKYKETPHAKVVKYYRDSVMFRQAAEHASIYSMKKYLTDYPDSYFKDKAREILDRLWQKKYYETFRSLDITEITRFEHKYPDYPYYDDSTLIYKDLAIKFRALLPWAGYKPELKDKYIAFIENAAPMEPAFVILQKLISPDLYNHRWNSAIDTLEKYKPYFPDDSRIDTLISLLKRKDKPLKKSPLDGKVNTPDGYELMPVVTADDRTMYFVGEERPDNLGNEDIFVTHKKDNVWQEATLVPQLNTEEGNEAPLSVTPDGNTLIFFRNGSVYMSEKQENGWSYPKPIKKINRGGNWDADAFITADGNAIIFASDRPNPSGPYHAFNQPFHGDYIGNTDLWVIVKTDKGWSDPINLGQTINTPFSERTPFLHPDMKTLYFSSDGHASFGRMDVFVSHRLSDTSWTEWSEPENLGKYFNTPDKEYGYRISTDGKLAYYSQFDNKQADIYTVILPENARPDYVVTVVGYVKNKKGEPLEAAIVWEDLTTAKEIGRLKSDPATGYYVITLPAGRDYGVYVSSKGYYPISGNLDLNNLKQAKTVHKDFVLAGIEDIMSGDTSIRLNNIFFDFNSAKLKPESYPELNRFARFIKEHPGYVFEISGHTDNIGSEDYNKKLSLERAETVRDYLISKGCNKEQIKVKGYGASKPVADNTTDKGRALNRRVEFRVLGKKK